ncbi:efflux RND transporter periplasmic adaptor subunit [Paenibacillus oryzisoli]|uniref:RND transporter n=1 Tax=Paenibacillus oryzisoli TaxID=1850517 RepID=A0A198AIC7_9BACL|nr:RND transporter [Paenibacillus oryzisoli]
MLEAADNRRKRMIQIMFIAFIGVMLFFTFFSNSLQSLTLPKVRTEPVVKGSFDFTLETSGNLRAFDEVQVSNPAGWKVEQIFVKQGDHVQKGQKLINYNSKSAQRELADEMANLDTQKIEMDRLQDQYVQLVKEGDELKIRNAKRDIDVLKLGMATQQRKINELGDQLASQKELNAPFDGVIMSINATEGMASAGKADILMANDSLGFRLDSTVDAALVANLGISVGEPITIEVQAGEDQHRRKVNGTIQEMLLAQPRTERSSGETGETQTIPQKVLSIKVVDPALKGGELAWIKLKKPSRSVELIVSNDALHQDREGTYVYAIQEQRGALGNIFVVRIVRVQSVGVNGKETMIQSDSLFEGDPLIVESSEPLQEGNRIRLQ